MKARIVFREENTWNYDLEKMTRIKGFVDYVEEGKFYKFIYDVDWNFPFKPSIKECIVFLNKKLEIVDINYNLNHFHLTLFCKLI